MPNGLREGYGYRRAAEAPPATIGYKPQRTQFNPAEYAAGQGYQPYTPTGQPFPTSPGAYSGFLEKQYGMTAGEFQEAMPEERYAAFAGQRGMAGTYEEYARGREADKYTGPPKSPQEAAWATYMETQAAQEQRQQMFQNAVSTMQYAFGLLRRGGPGSLGASQSPMLGQLAQMQAAYQPETMDYSYWLTPGAYGVQETEFLPTEIQPGAPAGPQFGASATGYPGWTGRGQALGPYQGLWG